MTENDKTTPALIQRLGEMVKENVELEQRVHELMDDYNRVVKQLNANTDGFDIGSIISKTAYPIVIKGVNFGDTDYVVLSQGMLYSFFYNDGPERKMLYVVPQAYYPSEYLLECYLVIGTTGEKYDHLFMPDEVSPKMYDSIPVPFPKWAQKRNCISLDKHCMNFIGFHNESDIDNVKAMLKQAKSQYELSPKMSTMRGCYCVRLKKIKK